MVLHVGAVAALAFSALWSPAQAQDVKSVPAVKDFLVRHAPKVAVIGDYVYIDGGHISQLVDGDAVTQRPMNHTLSIDMSESWNAKDVELQELSQDSPGLTLQALLTDESSDSFYVWGGYRMRPQSRPEASSSDLWKFTADGSGGGSWEAESQDDAFTNLVRSQAGASVSTRDAAFHFGGRSTTDSTTEPEGPVPGYFHFNFTTDDHSWQNETEAPYSSEGTLYGATATWVPTFGPNGLIVLLGGQSLEMANPDNEQYLPMDEVHFMDPVTKTWYKQKTTGALPARRMFHCAVGVESTNGTFEIFMFGGHDSDRNVFDSVHVLSLPGFTWIDVDSAADQRRAAMACAVVGQRQMLTVGGTDLAQRGSSLWTTPDSFPQGLGIFDMTDLRWKSSFDASARAYESPQSVKDWYERGRLEEVSWEDEDVKSLFASSDGSDNSSGASTDNNGSGDDSSSDDSSSDDGPNAGAIAGGVVGGVAVAALIVALVWFFRRRQARKLQSVEHQPSDGPKAVGDASTPQFTPPPAELANPEVAELHADPAPARSELDGSTTASPRSYFAGSPSTAASPVVGRP